MKLPIGISSFREVREQGYFFADKSALVRLVLDASAKVMLVPRPRRFGKTLGISMLKCFLDRGERDAVGLFEGLAIAEDEKWMAKLGRFPVLCLSLKGVRGEDWQVAHDLLAYQIAGAAQAASELGEFLTGRELNDWERLCAREADEAGLRQSLKSLLTWLYRCHGERVVVLIDEYDTPILEAHSKGYYDRMISFMLSWLGEGLKPQDMADLLAYMKALPSTKRAVGYWRLDHDGADSAGAVPDAAVVGDGRGNAPAFVDDVPSPWILDPLTTVTRPSVAPATTSRARGPPASDRYRRPRPSLGGTAELSWGA